MAQAQPVQLHRARFLDYTPSPITAISFAPLPLPPPEVVGKGKGKEVKASYETEEFGVLVVARENGSIEIWEWARDDEGGVGNWVLEKVLPPTLTHPTVSLMVLTIKEPLQFHRKSYNVPKLGDLRLFTAGSEASDLVERCLLTGRILQTYPIPSPPIWSLSVSPTHTLLCLSTTSPNLTFITIPDDSPTSTLSPAPPHLLRTESLPSRTRTVSIAWGPPRAVLESEEWVWRDTYLVTGNSDSSFRKWDIPLPLDGSGARGAGRVTIRGRSVVEKIQKGVRGGRKGSGNQKGTIVWGIGVLPDHTIVTSDSLGSVTFWDGASLAQKQSFQAHKADGMCLAIGPSGKTVYSSGPDQRVCQFTCVPSSPNSVETWRFTANRRIHSHDVRALSIFPPYTPYLSLNPHHCPILASGGWDMSLALTPAASPDIFVDKLKNPLGKVKGLSRMVFEESFARKLSYLGGGRGTGIVALSRGARLVLARKERSVGVWRVLDDEQGWEKVLEMDLRLRTSLVSATISQNGQWLAVSDLYETKLFHLDDSIDGLIKPKRITSFHQTLLDSQELDHLPLETTGTGSSALLFTPDSQRLILGLSASSQVVIVELPPGAEDDVRVMKCFKRTEAMSGGRVVNGIRKSSLGESVTPNGLANGHADVPNGTAKQPPAKTTRASKRKANGHAAPTANGHTEDEDEDESSDDDMGEPLVSHQDTTSGWISTLATSDDGQWLAVADLMRRVYVFNLDTLRQTAVLPTLPSIPLTLAFAPTHPSLLVIASPTGAMSFYHLDHRRFLAHIRQINILNNALREQYTPAEGLVFEPSRTNPRSTKVVVWSHDWLCTARLDLDALVRQGRRTASLNSTPLGTPTEALEESSPSIVSKTLRRKRAREAKEALEMVSISGSGSPSDRLSTPMSGLGSFSGLGKVSSKDDPNFYKISNDKYRGVAHVDWLGEGEMIIVERPMSDFMGELPAPFWTAGFGRA